MKTVTAISAQAKNADRVNVSIDGAYRFSLDIFQVSELGIKIGKEYSEEELLEIENESQFGKLYARALEYCLMRPHSAREVRDYLWRKTRVAKYKSRDGTLKERAGVSQELTERVFERLQEKGYIDDQRFATFWVEYRNQTKGSSLRKLTNELRAKGVPSLIIDDVVQSSERNDHDELSKVIAKKAARYPDRQKLTQYLVRQGFRYDDVKEAVTQLD